MGESEFGKGLVLCLVKFAEHRERFQHTLTLYEDMAKKNPDLFDDSQAVEMYFNAASDHLYEIEVPPEWQKTKLGRLVKKLQDTTLEIGHGFTDKKWEEEEVNRAHELCQEIAILIDRKLGLSPSKGSW